MKSEGTACNILKTLNGKKDSTTTRDLESASPGIRIPTWTTVASKRLATPHPFSSPLRYTALRQHACAGGTAAACTCNTTCNGHASQHTGAPPLVHALHYPVRFCTMWRSTVVRPAGVALRLTGLSLPLHCRGPCKLCFERRTYMPSAGDRGDTKQEKGISQGVQMLRSKQVQKALVDLAIEILS